MKSVFASLAERLRHWSVLVEAGYDTPCLIWNGHAQRDGYKAPAENGAYGKINLWYKKEDEPKGFSRKFPVHWVSRVLYEIQILVPGFDSTKAEDMEHFWDLFFAYRALRLSIDHVCVNTLCINPCHLEWVLLAKNNGRKRWRKTRRKERINAMVARADRHSRLLERHTASVESFRQAILHCHRFRVQDQTRSLF